MHCSKPNRGVTIFVVSMVALLGIGTLVLTAEDDSGTTSTQANTVPDETTPQTAPTPDSATSAGVLEADKETHDFGEIPIFDGPVSTTYTLKNSGTEALIITQVTTSCMCTKASIDGITFGMHMNHPANIALKPGEEKTMAVVFDPLAHGPDATGPVTRIISIETNSSTTPKMELKVSGNVTKP